MPSLSPAGTINVASRTGPSREQSRRVARAGRRLDDGEYVVNHSLITDDDGPTAVRFDLWRIENQRVVQHWADEEPWVPETANGHTEIDGTRAIDHNADTAETRRIAHGAVQSILVDGDTSALDDHLAGKRTCSTTRASPTA